jgi:hypothetical protein
MQPMLFPRPVLLAAFPLVALNLIIMGCASLGNSPIAPLLEGRQAAVFVFLAPDCPLSQNYIATLNDLRAKFQASGIEFLRGLSRPCSGCHGGFRQDLQDPVFSYA